MVITTEEYNRLKSNSNLNKNIMEANIELQNENKMVKNDIKNIIKYYTTENLEEKENLERSIKETIEYYKKVK